MADITLPISKLLLDEQNPRHRPVTTQQQALAEVVRRGPGKIIALAKDIVDLGVSPIDRCIVMKDSASPTKYIVLEGNRRLASLRMLSKPEICPNPTVRSRLEGFVATGPTIAKKLRCFEVKSREEARPWLDRRHGGEMEGAGTVRWSSMQRTRNASNPGQQERAALTTLDWLDAKSAAGANQALADLLEAVAEAKFTTFGRLAADPDFRSYCGFNLKGDLLSTTDTVESVLARLMLVLQDFAKEKGLTVTELLKKPQRLSYIETLRARMAGADETHHDTEEEDDVDDEEPEGADPPGDDGPGDTGGAPDKPGDPGPGPTPKLRLFDHADLSHCGSRTKSVLGEVKKLPVRSYPNSAAALIRMVVELATMEAHGVCGWPEPVAKNKTLAQYVKNALNQLDPSKKAKRYHDLRSQLDQPISLISATTLNQFLHNPDYFPSAPDMRVISEKYTVLLVDLNEAIGQAKGSS